MWLTAGGIALWLAAGWFTAWYVTRPSPQSVPPLTTIAGVPVQDVAIETSDGVSIVAWLLPRDPTRCVVLLGGIRGSRMASLPRVSFYLERGWSVLLPDLRGTGASGGDRITLGWQERLDVAACCEALRQRGFERIGLHGASLGAAAIAYAQAEEPLPGLAFAVLESCYDDIRRALTNRLSFVPFARVAFLPVEWAARWRLGVDVERLQPMQALRHANVPMLIVAGNADTRVGAEDTQRLFDACGSPNKRLLWIRGGGHVDLWEFAPVEYAATLTAFLGSL